MIFAPNGRIPTSILIGSEFWFFFAFYVIGMLGLVKLGKSGSRFNGILFSFSTFVAIFSGYIVVGAQMDGFKNGFIAFKWLPAILFGMLGTQLFAARLIKLSKIREYASPLDFISDRYRSNTLTMIASLLMVASTIGFFSVQLSAMGAMMSSLSGSDINRFVGAMLLATVVLVHEILSRFLPNTFGSLFQTIIISFGIFSMYLLHSSSFGGMQFFISLVKSQSVITHVAMTDVPSLTDDLNWLLFAIPFIALPLYPQMLTLIVNAKSAGSFRTSMIFNLIASFIVIPAVVLTGIGARSVIYAEGSEISALTQTLMLAMLDGQGGYFLSSLVVLAMIASLIASSSAALSSINTVVALDFFRLPMKKANRHNHHSSISSTQKIALVSSIASTGVALGLSQTVMALDSFIISFVEIQNAFIVQLIPGFLAGLYTSTMGALPVIVGIVLGTLSSLPLLMIPSGQFNQLWIAFIGLGVNGITVLIYHMMSINDGRKKHKHRRRHQETESVSESDTSDSSESPLPAIRWATKIPDGMIGYCFHQEVQDDEYDVESARWNFQELSITHVSQFSESVPDDLRIRRGVSNRHRSKFHGGKKEPIHAPMILGFALVFLLFTSSFYLRSGSEVTPGFPNWTIISLVFSLVSGLLLATSMYISWDTGNKSRSDDDSSNESRNGESSSGSMSTSSTTESSVSVSEPVRKTKSHKIKHAPAPELSVSTSSYNGNSDSISDRSNAYELSESNRPNKGASVKFVKSVKNSFKRLSNHRSMPKRAFFNRQHTDDDESELTSFSQTLSKPVVAKKARKSPVVHKGRRGSLK